MVLKNIQHFKTLGKSHLKMEDDKNKHGRNDLQVSYQI